MLTKARTISGVLLFVVVGINIMFSPPVTEWALPIVWMLLLLIAFWLVVSALNGQQHRGWK